MNTLCILAVINATERTVLVMLLFAILSFPNTLFAQSPETRSLPAFPVVEEVRLKNGFRGLLVADKKQDRITLRVQFGSGTALDAFGKEGSHALAVHILAGQVQMRLSTRTTVSVSADASAITLNLRTSALAQALVNMAELLMKPNIETANLNLVRNVMAYTVDSVMLPTEPMASAVVYGFEHPYSRLTTPERLKKLMDADVQSAFKALSMPNNTTLYCTGNITKKSLAALVNTAFGKWQSREAPYLPRPRALPQENAVYAMELPADEAPMRLKGNTARIAWALDAPMRNDMDYDAYCTATAILEKRLQSTLPADAGCRATVSRHKYGNYGVIEQNLSAQTPLSERMNTVRKAVSTIMETAPSLDEIKLFRRQPLERFTDQLRSPERLLMVLAEAETNNITLKELRGYAKRLQALTPEAVQTAAKRYFQPERGFVVIGDSAALSLQTTSMQGLGQITRYTRDGEPILAFDTADITLAELLTRHQEALGGTTATTSVSTLITTTQTQLSAMAQKFPGTIVTKQKYPGKIVRKLEIAATQILQELWCDGQNAFDKIEMMGQEQPLKQRDAKETESALFDAQIFPALTMKSCGFQAELLGKRNGNYVVKAETTNGTRKTLSFDATTYLLSAIEEFRQTPQGIIKSVQEFREYAVFQGVKLPTTIVLKTGPGVLIGKSTYEINVFLNDEVFRAPK